MRIDGSERVNCIFAGGISDVVQGQVSAGADHACAIKPDGTAWCWGWNRAGQLGDATDIDKTYPVLVSGGGTWLQISAGGRHTCALQSDGKAWCWGSNGNGQLGDGSSQYKLAPVQVSAEGTWVQITAGGDHTCGIKSDGTAWCFGINGNGELGGGITSRSVTLGRYFPGTISGNDTWLQLSAGFSHTCGVTTTGRALCWGYGAYGQLGNGKNKASSTPVDVSGYDTWLQVTAGQDHTCGILLADSSAWCWGENSDGQLGVGGEKPPRRSSIPVPVAGYIRWVQLNAGRQSTCGIAEDRSAFCWGLNRNGQLGDGGMDNQTAAFAPVPVAGGLTWKEISASFASQSRYRNDNFVYGVTTDDRVLWWGYNVTLGFNSTKVSTNLPQPVDGDPGPWSMPVHKLKEVAAAANISLPGLIEGTPPPAVSDGSELLGDGSLQNNSGNNGTGDASNAPGDSPASSAARLEHSGWIAFCLTTLGSLLFSGALIR